MTTLSPPNEARSTIGRRPASVALSASVRAVGLAKLDGSSLAASRKRPGPIPAGWSPIAPTLLKSSDDQTVAAVAAVLAAVAEDWDRDAGPGAFADWGIVVASRSLGRSQLVLALSRFANEGVWGVSPHLIPHFALHSPSGTLSLALGSHGPNVGVGGGAGGAVEGGMTALTWLSEGRLPGVWLVLTGHEPESVPGPRGEPTTDSECRALALALVPGDPALAAQPGLRAVVDDGLGVAGRPDLAELHARLVARPPVASPSIYRPHLGFSEATGPEPVTVAADPVAGLRLEWVVGDVSRREGL